MAIKRYSNKNVALLKKLEGINKRLDKIEQNQKSSLDFAVMGFGFAVAVSFGGLYFSQPAHNSIYLAFALVGAVIFVVGYMEFIRQEKPKK